MRHKFIDPIRDLADYAFCIIQDGYRVLEVMNRVGSQNGEAEEEDGLKRITSVEI